jgi:hypothetical protein
MRRQLAGLSPVAIAALEARSRLDALQFGVQAPGYHRCHQISQPMAEGAGKATGQNGLGVKADHRPRSGAHRNRLQPDGILDPAEFVRRGGLFRGLDLEPRGPESG